ncbi:MAG: hypothetical protein JSV26_10420 [bacterium]|nr:MAG: hypothetical protein JSV26_10420 [bacterium]
MEKELEKVKGALDDFRKKVVEVVKKGKGEADRVARLAHLKLEIGSLNRQRKDLFEELGEAFYRNYRKPGKNAEKTVADLVSHVNEVEKRLASFRRDLKAEEKVTAPARKGRGRPSKPASAKTGGEAPKRRGRPPKSAAAKSGSAAPKRRGRPPKPAAASKAAQAGTPKKRGRPPKSEKTD